MILIKKSKSHKRAEFIDSGRETHRETHRQQDSPTDSQKDSEKSRQKVQDIDTKAKLMRKQNS